MLTPVHSLRARYRLALGLVAVLAIAAFIGLNYLLHLQQADASRINEAGRQRMLSQRIPALANLVVQGQRPGEVQRAREELQRAIREMDYNHHGLVYGDPAREWPAVEQGSELDRLYFGPAALDRHVETFLDDARAVAAVPSDPAALERLNRSTAGSLLPDLHQAVLLNVQASEARTEALRRGEAGLLALTLGLLALEALLIFRPASQLLERSLVKMAQEQELLLTRERENAALLERTQLALKARKEFMATMSHEVRTPLNAVLGMAELLGETSLDAEQYQMVRVIRESGEGLLGVLNDILDMAKLDAGRMELEHIAYSPEELLQGVGALMRGALKSDRVTLRVEGVALPKQLKGDPQRIRQVLLNLVGNAVKFTRQGEVSVTALWAQDRLRVEVRDSGIGISEEAQRALFEPFVQGEMGTSRRFGGTGLGLAICKRLLDLMGGRLELQSTLGVGSCFSFEIPAPIAAAASPVRVVTDSVALPARVLVVDDNPVNVMVVQRMLKQLGVDSEVAEHGRQALERAGRSQFDLVLMDCHMPEMDGYEATRRLHKSQPALPIVALTAGLTPEEQEACWSSGMDAILAKPVSMEKLRAELGRWGGERQSA